MTIQNLSSNLASRKTLASADMAMPYDQWGLRANTWTRPSDWLTLPTMTETSEKMVALVAVHPHDSNYFAFTITCLTGTYSVNWGDGTSNANVTSGVQVNKLYTYSTAALNGTESTRGYRQAIVQVTADGAVPMPANVLIVGGGGGGGASTSNNGGGGGGAGGYIALSNYGINAGTFTIVVGDGGKGARNGGAADSTSGNVSSAFGYTAAGGGRGGSDTGSNTGGNGGSGGGNGGSGGAATANGNIPSLYPSQGNNGGAGGTGTYQNQGAGGGGGAGAVGQDRSGGTSGAGGAGLTWLDGNTYAGGGGGGASNVGTVGALGGDGGGASGASTGTLTANSGNVNTGGGGGGAAQNYSTNTNIGGNGGSGVVIIRHSDAYALANTTGSPTVTTSGGTRTYKFTNNGTITFAGVPGVNYITGIDINKKHPQVGLQQHNTPILDLGIAGSFITTLQLSSNGNFVYDYAGGLDVKYMLTEQVNIYRLSNSITTLARLFQQYRRLKSVPNMYIPTSLNNFSYAFADTGIATVPDWMTTKLSNVNDVTYLFSSSRALQEVPDMNFNGSTLVYGMFQSCENLIEVRLTQFTKATNAGSMFYLCYGLQRVVLGDFPACTNFGSMFRTNYALRYAYIGKSSNVTDFSYMFENCRLMRTAPMMDLSKATTVTSMFSTCHNLVNVPAYDTRNVTNFSAMFASCKSLKNIPNFNTSKGTNFQSTFDNKNSLEQHPKWDFSNGTNFYGLFTECWNLRSINMYIPNATTTNRFANGCQGLETVTITDMGKSLDSQYMFQSAHAMRTVNLSNTGSVTNWTWAFAYNYGLAAAPELDMRNATTIDAMFYGCSGLRYIPLYNTANVTGFTSVFYNNYNLTAVPAFNTKNVTAINSVFYQCNALKDIPASFDLANCLTFNEMFYGCISLTKAPAIVMSKATDATGMFSYCNSLGDATNLSNVRASIGFYANSMSANNLNRLYTNLPTRSGVTIDVTGNYGTTLDTPSIATSKGWTVTC